LYSNFGEDAMQVTKELFIGPVTFGGGGDRLDIQVLERFLDDGGKVIGTGERYLVQSSESAALAIANARGAPAWDNPDIEQIVREYQVIDQPELQTIPGVPAVERGGKVIREAVAPVAGRPATYKSLFDADTRLSWQR
jgi:hypothetical protein